MIAKVLISNHVPPLRPSDSAEKALNWMTDFHVSHLPIVHDGKLLGLLSEDELLGLPNQDMRIESTLHYLRKVAVNLNQHLFDVLKTVIDWEVTAIPVIHDNGDYLGVITTESLLKNIAKLDAIVQPGGILILQMDPKDYSMAEIGRLVESENGQILSSLVHMDLENNELLLTLKINKKDLKHIAATLERFGYHIKNSFYESDYLDTLQSHYDSFIKYLEI